jgi:hypothetical protein
VTDAIPQLGQARSNWRTVILVCRKCEKRLHHRGFGPRGKDRLSKALKKAVKAYARSRGLKSKGRVAPVGIVEMGCQKLCPRGGVTVVLSNRPDRWLVARAGVTPQEVLAAAGVSPDFLARLPSSADGR